jgi:MFS family permease
MNQNFGLAGCDESVNDILENIPSDAERRAATEGDTRRGGGYDFRRPASFRIFRRQVDHGGTSFDDDRSADDNTVDTNLRTVMMSQSAGEDPEERKISALDVKKKEGDIYNISSHDEQIDPLSNDYIGIIANYFSVGLMIGGSTSLLYPVLIVKAGATASLMTASYAVVMVFWSYKIVFGFLSDCFPIFGYKRKPYIVIGWLFCAAVLIALAREGNDVDPRNLVVMFALANMGYVWADVASDGFMVWIAHREPIEKRGKMQTLVYSMNKLGQIAINLIILLGFSGPEMNCPGYEPDPQVPCTNNIYVIKRVDPELYANNPYSWCYEMCNDATFEWDLSIPEFAISICFVIFASIPLYLRLKEDKVQAEPRMAFLAKFWSQLSKSLFALLVLSLRSNTNNTLRSREESRLAGNSLWNDFTYNVRDHERCKNASKLRVVGPSYISTRNNGHLRKILFLCWAQFGSEVCSEC